MPPKKGGKKGGGKKKKTNKPSWMTDAMYDLSLNLQKLNEFWTGDIKETKLKEGQEPPPNISREQAGLFIWQLLYPQTKAAKEKREESVKLGLVETSVRIVAKGEAPEVTPAVGILTAMTRENEVQRGVMLDAKPSPIPQLLRWLGSDSASLRAAVCALIRVLASNPDSRPRLWRAMRQDWDWAPLVSCLQLNDLSQLGGRAAAFDAAATIEALCCAPEQDLAAAACTAACNYSTIPAIVKVLQTRNAHPMAKACGVAVLNAIMRRSSAAVCEDICMARGALEPLVAVFLNQVIPLPYKAHAAACLLRYIMPDRLWKDSSVLAAKGAKAPPPGGTAMADPTEDPESGGADRPAGEGQVTSSGMEAVNGGPVSVVGSPPGTADGQRHTLTSNSGGPGGAGHDGLRGTMTQLGDIDLLDDATREEVLARARNVAVHKGSLRAMVELCRGPDGPLPDLEAPPKPEEEEAGADKPADKGKGKGKAKAKKGKKGKKGKLEPGMAEAQTYGSAVLRLVSLSEDMRTEVAAAGAVRYLLPLLESKISAARWNARQALVNLSMSPALVDKLKLYKVPDYIHGSNMPSSHFQRPHADSSQPAGGPPLKKQDSLKRGQAAAGGKAPASAAPPPPAGGSTPGATPTTAKPPALKETPSKGAV